MCRSTCAEKKGHTVINAVRGTGTGTFIKSGREVAAPLCLRNLVPEKTPEEKPMRSFLSETASIVFFSTLIHG